MPRKGCSNDPFHRWLEASNVRRAKHPANLADHSYRKLVSCGKRDIAPQSDRRLRRASHRWTLDLSLTYLRVLWDSVLAATDFSVLVEVGSRSTWEALDAALVPLTSFADRY